MYNSIHNGPLNFQTYILALLEEYLSKADYYRGSAAARSACFSHGRSPKRFTMVAKSAEKADFDRGSGSASTQADWTFGHQNRLVQKLKVYYYYYIFTFNAHFFEIKLYR